MSVKVERLTKIYGTQTALNDLSFTIGTNRIVGFLGPNGAGKSTTMKILAGVLAPTSGNGEVQGIQIGQHSFAAKKKTGVPSGKQPTLFGYVRSRNIELRS